jgi:hypothetical protein
MDSGYVNYGARQANGGWQTVNSAQAKQSRQAIRSGLYRSKNRPGVPKGCGMTKVEDNGESVLKTIVGARLTSVQFVLNYLILGFDEKGALTSLVWPEVVVGEKHHKFGMNCYRDFLCELIEKVVSEVKVTSDETVLIKFDSAELRIPLKTYAGAGEKAIFTGAQHQLFVW